jgi:hypothetical protein
MVVWHSIREGNGDVATRCWCQNSVRDSVECDIRDVNARNCDGGKETAMEKKETSGSCRPGVGARTLPGTVGNERSGHQRQKLRWKNTKRRGRGNQVLVLEFCREQRKLKHRGRQCQKLGRQKPRWKKKKCRGRGSKVPVQKGCQEQ